LKGTGGGKRVLFSNEKDDLVAETDVSGKEEEKNREQVLRTEGGYLETREPAYQYDKLSGRPG